MHVVLSILIAVVLLYWITQAALFIRTMQVVPTLCVDPRASRSDDPLVSVIVPARNEQAVLESALRSRLTDPDPNLQFIFVNDRSTDRTGQIMASIAEGDPRVEYLEIEELPEGWLGKVHAMHSALALVRGSWILLSDADVHVAPGVVRRTVDLAESAGVEHLAALPAIRTPSLGLRLCLSPLMRLLMFVVRLWSVHVRGSSAAMGVGAFNLVRRDAFAAAGGLEALRMEVIDDIGVGAIIKRSGGGSLIVAARDGVRLAWYDRFTDFLAGLERGTSRLPRWMPRLVVVAGGIALGLLDLLPVLLLLCWPWWPLVGGIGLAATALMLTISVLLARHFGFSVPAALCAPLGIVLCTYAACRAVLVGARDGTIRWRGTTYSVESLQAGAQFRFHDRSEGND